MSAVKVVRKKSSVLPPKKQGPAAVTEGSRDEGPALPGRDPKLEKRQKSINLSDWIWDALEQISATTEVPAKKPGKKPVREYSVNEVCEHFLKNRIARWLDDQLGRKTHRDERSVPELRAELAELLKNKR
jgi:hypothetical protein